MCPPPTCITGDGLNYTTKANEEQGVRKQFLLSGVLITVLWGHIVTAQPTTYMAQYGQNAWSTEGDILSCRLTHIIPEYGKILFRQNAGADEIAMLEVWYKRGIEHYQGELSFHSPHCMGEQIQKPGWKFAFQNKGQQVIFSARQARTILDALDEGLLPTFLHRNNNNRREMVRAQISTIQFQEAFQQYSACQANLMPVTFEEIRTSNVFFETGSVRLDEQAKVWLSYVIAYAKDPDIRRIEISGFTDSVGSFRANHKLASERVEKVRLYLIGAGIPEQLLRLKVFGEQRPLAKNTSEHGRSQNRRVEVKLWR